MKQVYKTEIRKFFDMEGRFISIDNDSWLVLKDMFNWLGRLRADGQLEGQDTRRLNEFLIDINEKSALKNIHITSKGKKQSREVQEVNCIKIDVVPMVLTQFKPRNLASRTQEENENKLNQWRELMQFINAILKELEIYKFITEDKKHQNRTMERLQKLLPQELDNPSSYKRVNSDIAKILQVLGGTSVPIYKPMIQEKICEHTKEVLLEREEVLEAYINAYEMFGDFDYAKAMTIQIIKKRYSL